MFPPGLKKLSTTFRLCKPLANQDDYIHLLGWARNSFTNLAMFDYPYPAHFFSDLPANPVKVSYQPHLHIFAFVLWAELLPLVQIKINLIITAIFL